MILQVRTTNGQQGNNSVETVEVLDGDQLLVTIIKVGNEKAEVTVYEALKPDLKGAIVFVEDGANAPQAKTLDNPTTDAPAPSLPEAPEPHYQILEIDKQPGTSPKRTIKIGK